VRNEKLVSNPEKELESIFDFLEMELSTASAAFLRKNRINSSYLNFDKKDIHKAKDPAAMPQKPWTAWSARNKRLFTKITKKTMTSLGYDLFFD
jgi:hypothetical protein